MNWHVVTTASSKERLAEARLQSRGFETFLPRLQSYDSNNRKVIEPLFPNYLFVYSNPEELQIQINFWKAAQTKTGIYGILTTADNTPIPVDSVEVYVLKMQLDPISGILIPEDERIPEYTHNLQVGDKVTGKPETAWAHQVGKITSLRGRDRVMVLLQALGASMELELQADLLLKETPVTL